MTLRESILRAPCTPIHSRTACGLLAALMVSQAFREAQRGSRLNAQRRTTPEVIRKSRKDAANAIRWLRARTRWTKVPLEQRQRVWGGPAPPAVVRSEYGGTFSWCCEVLGLDEDQVRREGPPFGQRQRSFPGGLADWRIWRADRL